MSRKDVTAELSEKVAKKLRRQFAIVAQEVWVDPDHRVDFVAFSPGSGGRNVALEHGKFVFVEVKSCMADFKSGHGLTFLGDENWLVCTRDLAHELRGGSITADPYFRSGQDTACTHCDYLTVCHFTPGMGGDCHRVLTKLPADKVWSNLKGGTPDA